MAEETVNPLLCDPNEGVCGIPGLAAGNVPSEVHSDKPVRIIYFTDPICSSCWGIEPRLRKLKLEYGESIRIDYRMGGLLPDWSYNSGGISKPADVAPHWDEVSRFYKMPIDGDVWLEDPLHSSYPPSVAFKAAQMQDETRAVVFLRTLREYVFLEKKNITRWEYLEKAAVQAQLDVARLEAAYTNGTAEALFREDLALAARHGVRGFPTLIFSGSAGNSVRVYGFKPYEDFENAIQLIAPGAAKSDYDRSREKLFEIYPTLTLTEYSELSGQPEPVAAAQLDEWTRQHYLTALTIKNGTLWSRNR